MNKHTWIELKINDTILWRFTIDKEENLKKLQEFMKELYRSEE